MHIALAISAAGCLCTQTKALSQQRVRIAMLWAMLIVITLCVCTTASLTESTGDCLLPDDARLACYTTLLPRCGYLDSFVMSRNDDYVKAALALMLMLLIGLALVLIPGAVPLELGRWWFIVVLFSCGVDVFLCIICIHGQTVQTSSVGESLLADATDGRVWSLYFNFVFNSVIFNLTETRKGHCTIGLVRLLGYIRVAVVIVLMVVFSLDVKCLSRFNVVFVVNISVIIVTACVIFGYVSNWTVKEYS